MHGHIMPLIELPYNKNARIVRLEGGHGFQRKMRVMGFREGKIIKIITRQPMRGPITIDIEGSQTTLGRGMTKKVFVEVIE